MNSKCIRCNKTIDKDTSSTTKGLCMYCYNTIRLETDIEAIENTETGKQ